MKLGHGNEEREKDPIYCTILERLVKRRRRHRVNLLVNWLSKNAALTVTQSIPEPIELQGSGQNEEVEVSSLSEARSDSDTGEGHDRELDEECRRGSLEGDLRVLWHDQDIPPGLQREVESAHGNRFCGV
eukprot:759856-Hanusia_phi.AAC.2